MTILAGMKSTDKMGFINSILFVFLSITTSFNQSILHLPIVAANDVLLPGDELNSLDQSSILLSANGAFTLGFFNPLTNDTYLGIWKTNQEGLRVWVANRDIPFIGEGVLRIDDDSPTLKVVNPSGAALFNISNDHQVGSNSNIARAMLQDSGNFVLYDKGNRTIWQSFDHPTDTLTFGMKLGYNLTTGQNWTLTSWLWDAVPASGAFTMRLEQYQNSPQLLIYRHEELYWASGPWIKSNNDFQYFRSLVDPDFQINYDLISDNSGMYFIVTTPEASMYLSSKAQLIGQFLNSPKTTILDTTSCFGYQAYDIDIDIGCKVSTTLPYCRGQLDTAYRWESGEFLGNYGHHVEYASYDYNSSIGLGDCMERCWNDCDCTGISTSNDNGTGCMTWSGNQTTYHITDASVESGPDYILVLQKPPKETNKNQKWKLVVSLASVITSVLAAAFCFVMIRRRRRLKAEERRMKDDYIHQTLEKGIQDAPGVKILTLEAILIATDNFSNENKLGQGGYGPVYKRNCEIKKKIRTNCSMAGPAPALLPQDQEKLAAGELSW